MTGRRPAEWARRLAGRCSGLVRRLGGLAERVGALLARERFEAELDEELRFHLDRATERNLRNGMDPAAARRAARRALGGVLGIKDRVREETGVQWLQDVSQDLRHALRGIARRPGFAAVVVATVAACVGAHGAVFTVVRSVLLRPLPFPEPERLVRLYNSYPGAGELRAGNSAPELEERRRLDALEEVALYSTSSAILEGPDGGRHVTTRVVSPSFFAVLGVVPALGRAPRADETGTRAEVAISHGFWQSDLGGSAEAVGTTLVLDGAPHTVVGILPPSFRFSVVDARIFTPLTFTPRQRSDAARHTDWYQMIGRLALGATIDSAQAEVDAWNRSLLSRYPAPLRDRMIDAGFRTVVRSFVADLTRDVHRPLVLLWAGVGLVLLIGAANVTGLFTLRLRSRSREIAARMALGAGRLRIVRQLGTEGALLSLMGGGLGLLVARASLGLAASGVQGIPRAHEVSTDAVVLMVSVAAAVVLGVLAAGVPALLLAGGDGIVAFRGLGTVAAGPTARAQRLLAAGQIALTFVLVLCTGLLVASLRNLTAVDPGFDPGDVAVASLSLPDDRYPDEATRLDLTSRLLESLGSAPGVRSVAIADQRPFSGAPPRISVVAEGRDGAGMASHGPFQTVVSPGYLETLGIDLVAGRGFRAGDDGSAPRVVLVDEALARHLWPASDPVGRRIWRGRPGDPLDPAKALRVVGVVETIKHSDLREEPATGAFYVPVAQVPLGSFRILVGLDGPGAPPWRMLLARIAALDPALVPFDTTTLDESVAASVASLRVPLEILSAFAVLGLFLSALGVHGVMGQAVASRRPEIGLRLALGGTYKQIASLVARQCATVVGAGIVAGGLAAVVAVRALQGLLYETATLDPAVVTGALGIILGAVVVASALPLRRALAVDPARTLRE